MPFIFIFRFKYIVKLGSATVTMKNNCVDNFTFTLR